jgi:hypothetical protein
MYCSFVINNNYNILTYSFHRFETAFLFAALSITLSNWTSLLYEIHEFKLYQSIFSNAALVIINIIYSSISFVNFIFCLYTDDFEEYLNSLVYTISFFLQLATSFLLCLFIMFVGLKLLFRINGVAGNNSNYNVNNVSTQNSNFTPLLSPRLNLTSTSTSTATRSNKQAIDFNNALKRLVIVMTVCCLCILLKVLSLFFFFFTVNLYLAGYHCFYYIYIFLSFFFFVDSFICYLFLRHMNICFYFIFIKKFK